MCSLTYTRRLYQWQICMSQHGEKPGVLSIFLSVHSSIACASPFQVPACNSQPFISASICLSVEVWGWQADSLNPSQSQCLVKVSHMIHIDSVVLQLSNTFKKPLSSCWLDLRPFHHSILASSFIYIKKGKFTFQSIHFFSSFYEKET